MGRPLSHVASVGRDLAGLDLGARQSALAASASSLARRLDADKLLTARDHATLAAELRQTMAELRRQYQPAKRQEDQVDEIRARREARRAESSG
jgi:hypothetical protein